MIYLKGGSSIFIFFRKGFYFEFLLKNYKEQCIAEVEGNELFHEMNRQIFYERLNDQIPKENVKVLKEEIMSIELKGEI